MAKQTFNNLDGLYPALDRKKLAKPYCVDGKNFIVDLDGPKSAFGYKQPWNKFDSLYFMQSFPVGAEIFYFSRDVAETYVQVSKFDWLTQKIIPVEKFTANAGRPKLNLPWTHALVGSYHYFANRTWGVLRYDAINLNWEDVTATIGISDIFFITESDGRLITLADGLTSWSAVEDGLDNTPSLTTGAGFQALSIIGSLEQDSDYLGLQKIANGYLSFTTKGVLRSQIIDSVSPFRHVTGESDAVPLTPWCVTKINATEVVILTRLGLFISKDGVFTAWQPLFSEYLKQTKIPPLQSLDSGFVAIHHSKTRDEFYVSLAESQVLNSYTVTYALYLTRDQWGVFNRGHRGFVFLDTDDSGDDFRQAYISLEGSLNWLDDSVIPLVTEPQNAKAVYVPVKAEYPVVGVESIFVMPTTVRGHGFSYAIYPQVASFYEEFGEVECVKTEEVLNSEQAWYSSDSFVGYVMPSQQVENAELCTLGPTVQPPTQLSLDSYIEVGLFRFTDEEANDQLSEITNLAISCLDATESTGSEVDDWLNNYTSDTRVDWLAVTPDEFEDWGSAVVTGSTYSEVLKGTLDGYLTFEDQEVVPDFVQLQGKTKFLSAHNQGIFQSLRLDAANVGESYHLKTLEINGFIAGRL